MEEIHKRCRSGFKVVMHEVLVRSTKDKDHKIEVMMGWWWLSIKDKRQNEAGNSKKEWR